MNTENIHFYWYGWIAELVTRTQNLFTFDWPTTANDLKTEAWDVCLTLTWHSVHLSCLMGLYTKYFRSLQLACMKINQC